jgi:hypothetical protein
MGSQVANVQQQRSAQEQQVSDFESRDAGAGRGKSAAAGNVGIFKNRWMETDINKTMMEERTWPKKENLGSNAPATSSAVLFFQVN